MTLITSVQEFGAYLLRAHRVGALYPVALYASYLTLVIVAGLVSLLFNPGSVLEKSLHSRWHYWSSLQ